MAIFKKLSPDTVVLLLLSKVTQKHFRQPYRPSKVPLRPAGLLSLLFSIDDSVNLSLAETPDQKVSLTFDNTTMQDFFRKWCQFKNVYEKEKAEILAIENEDKRQEELDKLNATQEEWKLRAMGTTIGCHTIVKKGTEDTIIKTYDLT